VKPPPVDYVRPSSVRETVDLLATSEREMKVLAGGQSLMPVLNMRMAHPEVLVDISRIEELLDIQVEAGALRIGAAVTQSNVAADPRVREHWPMLAAAIELIGHPQLRNRGTLCGSLAHNDPAAELPAVAVLLEAGMTLVNREGARTVAAADFFHGTFTTSLEDGDLLVHAEFPRPPAGSGWAFREFAQRRGDFASAGVGVLLTRHDDAIGEVRVVLFGVSSTPVRAKGAEAAVRGHRVTASTARRAAVTAAAEMDPIDDIHASAEFRRELVVELVTDALQEAWERAR
jgi:CO/xanthine dehydrogenase FAD-binding subunit